MDRTVTAFDTRDIPYVVAKQVRTSWMLWRHTFLTLLFKIRSEANTLYTSVVAPFPLCWMLPLHNNVVVSVFFLFVFFTPGWIFVARHTHPFVKRWKRSPVGAANPPVTKYTSFFFSVKWVCVTLPVLLSRIFFSGQEREGASREGIKFPPIVV